MATTAKAKKATAASAPADNVGVPMRPGDPHEGPEDAYGTDELRGDYTGRTGDPDQAHYEGDRKQAG